MYTTVHAWRYTCATMNRLVTKKNFFTASEAHAFSYPRFMLRLGIYIVLASESDVTIAIYVDVYQRRQYGREVW